MRDIYKDISQLPLEKRALLEEMLQRKHALAGDQPPTQTHGAGYPGPLSCAQERMWFLYQLTDQGFTYHRSMLLRLNGSLQVRLLEKSLTEIVRRHEILRTTFTLREGQLTQHLLSASSLSLVVVDLAHLTATVGDSVVARIAQEESQRSFNLSQGPLFRCLLLSLAHDKHILILVMHHIISDGWSDAILMRELSALYHALLTNVPPALPKLPVQYIDFAAWQQQWLRSGEQEVLRTYWRERLGNNIPLLTLPTDYKRPAIQTFHGKTLTVWLSASQTARLQALARDHRITLFMLLLTAFNVLLHHYTGQTDICVSSPVANRLRSQYANLIGCFVNSVVLRTDLSGDPRVSELVERVRTGASEAFEHQDWPVEKLVEDMHPVRDSSRLSLLPVAFALQNVPEIAIDPPGLTIAKVPLDLGIAKTDLTFQVWKHERELEISCEYSTDLFKDSTIMKMLEHFQTLLDAIVAYPEQRLTDLLVCLPIVNRAATRFKDIYARTNLTKNQLLIWIGQKIQPELPLYNICMLFTLHCPIHVEHFRQAFQKLIYASDALRTVVEEAGDIPQQRVLDNIAYHMDYLDFSSLCDRESRLQEWAQQRSQQSFDLKQALFDTALIKLAEGKFAWFLKYHHLISDGWSAYIIFNRMAFLYKYINHEDPEAPLEIGAFQPFVDQQRAAESSSRYLTAAAYWQTKLAVEREPLTFHGRVPQKSSTRVRRLAYAVGLERTRRLKAFASQKELFSQSQTTSLFSLFATLLSICLYRISGCRTLVLGAPFHNRTSRVARQTIGLFMEILPLHFVIADDDTFLSVIKKAKREIMEAMRYSKYTLVTPVQNRPYDVFINYQTFGEANFNGNPFDVEWIHSGHEHDSLSLQIHDFHLSNEITLNFDFHTDSFNDYQCKQFIRLFAQTIDALLENSEYRVNHFPFLPSSEAQRIARYGNQRAATQSQENICALFEKQALLVPHQQAVVWQQHALTYEQLDTKANQLAHFLQKQQVGPEVPVGVYVERGLDIVVCVLAVLKAGGTYLPLDPTHTSERLAFILNEASISIILTQRDLVTSIPRCSARIIDLQAIEGTLAQERKAQPPRNLSPENAAYIIYTSGSTGEPKGVIVSHRNLASTYASWENTYNLQAGQTSHLQMANFSFDVFSGDFVRALCSGARLILCPREALLAPEQLYELICAEQITCAEFVPAVLRNLLLYVQKNGHRLDSFRTVLVGSDIWYGKDLVELRRVCRPETRCINSYGITEATIDSTFFDGQGADILPESTVPIGRPFTHVDIYILDSQGEQAPIGMPGELYIGGAGVARGYLHQPTLTAERFIPHPWSQRPGARLYRTGDRVRWREDGIVEFLGRTDVQVKVRGYRIEPAEVEAALCQHPQIAAGVVTVWQDEQKDSKLVAYLQPQPGTEVPSATQIRTFLQERLPDYFIPSLYVPLEALPLSPNGKLDRRQLPSPTLFMTTDSSYVVPQTDKEKIVARIWQEVLNIERVGLDDNFFEIGGHSLLLVQLQNKLEEEFAYPLSLTDLFQFTTVKALADYLNYVSGERQQPISQVTEIQDKINNGKHRLQQQLKQRQQIAKVLRGSR